MDIDGLLAAQHVLSPGDGDEAEVERVGERVRGEVAAAWGAVSGLLASATQKSLQAAQSARTELGHLVAAASDELAEAYSQSLEEHVQGVASAIPAIVSEGLAALGEQTAPSSETGPLSEMTPPTEFLLSDEAAHADWPVFAESPQCKAVFGEAQQAAILANNARVHAVFAEIVPQTISAEQFWVRWRLWCFLLPLQRADQPRPIASRDSEPQLRVAMRDSKSLDAVSVSLAARPEEWDDWE